MPAVVSPLVMPRRLALTLLGAAQDAQPRRIAGLVRADGAKPAGFLPITTHEGVETGELRLDESARATAEAEIRRYQQQIWAYVISHPTQPAEPTAIEVASGPYPNAIQLVISLNTKGVLEMRAWSRNGQSLRELELKVRD